MSFHKMDNLHCSNVFRVVLVQFLFFREWKSIPPDFTEKLERFIVVKVSEGEFFRTISFIRDFEFMPRGRDHVDVVGNELFQGESLQFPLSEQRCVVDIIQQEQQTAFPGAGENLLYDKPMKRLAVFPHITVHNPKFRLDIPPGVGIFDERKDSILPGAFSLHVNQEAPLWIIPGITVRIDGRQFGFAGSGDPLNDRDMSAQADFMQLFQFQNTSDKAFRGIWDDRVEA